MNRGTTFVIRIEHDPEGVFSKGAEIPYDEFLTGLRMGVYAEGMKVKKFAPVSDFTVAISKNGANILKDSTGTNWYVGTNPGNRGFIQARRR